MAFHPRAVLRPVLATATAAVIAAGFAGVAWAQDAGYHGPFLSWAGKTPAPAAAPEPAPAPTDDAGATYVVRRRAARLVEPQSAPTPAPRPAPASYAAPPPERAPPSDAEDAPDMAPATPPPLTQRTRLAPAAPSRAAIAAAPAAPDPTPTVAAGASPHVHVRFYSVDRPYGMTPDPIAMPVKRPMVLVGPPDAAAGQSDKGADGAEDGGKPAAHDDGHGADSAGDQTGDN